MRVYTGKVLGAFLGFVTLGVVGGLVGFFVGHMFDSGLVRAIRRTGPDGLHALQQEFFDTYIPSINKTNTQLKHKIYHRPKRIQTFHKGQITQGY